MLLNLKLPTNTLLGSLIYNNASCCKIPYFCSAAVCEKNKTKHSTLYLYIWVNLTNVLPYSPPLIKVTTFIVRILQSNRALFILCTFFSFIFMLICLIKTCLHMITMLKTKNYIKSHLCKISVSILTDMCARVFCSFSYH